MYVYIYRYIYHLRGEWTPTRLRDPHAALQYEANQFVCLSVCPSEC